MYSKQEASRLRGEFWMVFGQYMQPVQSAEGDKVNWVNYKTGEKDIYFRMQADNKSAYIGIEITHPDAGIRQLYLEQFGSFRKILESALGEIWEWQPEVSGLDGRPISRIYKSLEMVSIFKKEDWPSLISFFKPRIIALDVFWSNVRFSFEELR